MKILTVTISDQNHARLEEIKSMKSFGNNAEALEWMIEVSHKEAVNQKMKSIKEGGN